MIRSAAMFNHPNMFPTLKMGVKIASRYSFRTNAEFLRCLFSHTLVYAGPLGIDRMTSARCVSYTLHSIIAAAPSH